MSRTRIARIVVISSIVKPMQQQTRGPALKGRQA
jgi:hypothetical protein